MSDFIHPATTLPALPEFEPAADLWSRIEQRHARRRQTRWLGGAVGVASVALLAVAVFKVPEPHSTGDRLYQQRADTGQLEQEWQTLVGDGADGYAQLRPLDVALQQAYDRHADGAELSLLWNQRNQLLRELIRGRRDNVAVDALPASRISI
ncbi:MAG: hypothetical protein WBP11_02765 [Dokdonella sp.]